MNNCGTCANLRTDSYPGHATQGIYRCKLDGKFRVKERTCTSYKPSAEQKGKA